MTHAHEPNPIFSSRRSFRIWGYTISHGQLLLRSAPVDELTTIIDILFKGVGYLRLCAELDEPAIAFASAEQVANEGISDKRVLAGRQAYFVSTNSGTGMIVAGSLHTLEEPGSFSTPSKLYVQGL